MSDWKDRTLFLLVQFWEQIYFILEYNFFELKGENRKIIFAN